MANKQEPETENIVNFGVERSRKFLRELRDCPFLAVVLHEDGGVTVYDKSIGPDEVVRIREAIEGKLSERMDADGN